MNVLDVSEYIEKLGIMKNEESSILVKKMDAGEISVNDCNYKIKENVGYMNALIDVCNFIKNHVQ